MKIILILCIIPFLKLAVYGQNHELQVLYKFGFSTNNFHSPLYDDPISFGADGKWFGAKLLNDQTTEVNYKYQIWKKAKLYVLAGIEIGKTSYYLPIINSNWYQIGDINFNQKKSGYLIGLAKRINVYDSKLKIDFGFKFKNVYPFYRNENFANDWTFSETRDWIEYKYSLDADYRQNLGYYGERNFLRGFLRAETFLNVQFNLHKNWFLNFQVSYQRNNYFFYNYTFNIRYYLGGSTYPTNFENFYGISGGNNRFFKNDDLIYTALGLNYNFSRTNKTKKAKYTNLL